MDRNKCFVWELGKGYQGSYIILTSGLSLMFNRILNIYWLLLWSATDFLLFLCLSWETNRKYTNKYESSHSEHIWTVNISLHIVYMPGIIFYQIYSVQQVFLLTKFWMLMYIWVQNENNLIVLPNFWTAPNTLISKLISRAN